MTLSVVAGSDVTADGRAGSGSGRWVSRRQIPSVPAASRCGPRAPEGTQRGTRWPRQAARRERAPGPAAGWRFARVSVRIPPLGQGFVPSQGPAARDGSEPRALPLLRGGERGGPGLRLVWERARASGQPAPVLSDKFSSARWRGPGSAAGLARGRDALLFSAGVSMAPRAASPRRTVP